VRDTKGNEDRVTLLPEQLVPILREHLRHVKDVKTTMIYTHVLQKGPLPSAAPWTSQKPIHNSQSAIRNSPVLDDCAPDGAGAPALFPLLRDRPLVQGQTTV
jgi:hypothetical protein